MKITYFGHSCFMMEVSGKKLLFDPFISPNPLASKIDLHDIHPDYILISHGHEDHIADAESIAKKSNARVIASYEIVNWLGTRGVINSHAMNMGGSWDFEFGKVKCVTAVHSNSLPDGTYGGIAMGFIIESADGNFYFAGDTALSYDMKLIGAYKKIDFALLPIGNNFTMGIDNAIIAAEFINCKKIIGMHYDTFEAIRIHHQEAHDKFTKAGNDLTLMEIGQTIEI